MLFFYICIKCEPTVQHIPAAIINRSIIIPLQTSFEPDELATYLEVTRQHIENFNSENPETQSLSTVTSLRSSIALTERQLPGNDHGGTRLAMTPSREQIPPPAYESLVRQSSITITIEQQSLLPPPPTYDDFMRRNNERERYNIHDF
jgi:hypothetical protein